MALPTKRLDDLEPTVNPQRDHVFAAMRDGISNKIRIEQILSLLQTGDVPDNAVTLAKLAADARAAGNHTYDNATSGLSATDVQAAIDEAVSLVGVATRRGHIFGLTLSNNSADANNDIDIAPGEAASDDAAPVLLKLTSAITKRLDAAWAVGDGEGGLDTGTKANLTWYHLWLIRRSDTGVVDVLFSASATSPTMPMSYDQKRRLGAVRTDGAGNLDAFSQMGDEFLWGNARTDVNANNPGTAAVLRTLSVPPGIKVLARFIASKESGGAGLSGDTYLSSPDQNDQEPDHALGRIHLGQNNSANTDVVQGEFLIRTNTSAQIRSRALQSGAGTNFKVVTLGWFDARGRDL